MAGSEAGCLFVAALAQWMREINLKTIDNPGSSWPSARPPDNAGNIIRPGINIYNAATAPFDCLSASAEEFNKNMCNK